MKQTCTTSTPMMTSTTDEWNEIRRTPTDEWNMKRMQRSQSNASHVLLKAVEPNISGKFSCEVSADAPSFHTAYQTGEMEIVGKYKIYVRTARTKKKILAAQTEKNILIL